MQAEVFAPRPGVYLTVGEMPAVTPEQALAFTDGRATALGSTGQATARGSMSLANVAYATTLTWSHPYLTELERQAAVPIFGDDPIELGWT